MLIAANGYVYGGKIDCMDRLQEIVLRLYFMRALRYGERAPWTTHFGLAQASGRHGLCAHEGAAV